MMTLGPLGFLDPWLLTGLLALPAIWWLLRFTPPRPKRVVFPPTRLLKDLEDNKHTAEHSPWWLTLLRMILAALLILALARPLIYPDRESIAGQGPLVIAVDNGWASASHWTARQDMIAGLIAKAERSSRPIVIFGTAGMPAETLAPGGPDQARDIATGLSPKPYDPQRAGVAEKLRRDLGTDKGYSVVWLSDGIDYGGAEAFAGALTDIAGSSGDVSVVVDDGQEAALGLFAGIGESGALTARVQQAQDAARRGSVVALSSRGQPLGRADYALSTGQSATKAEFDLPLEIRNQVARLEIDGETSAGAVHLLDRRSQWRRVGMISGESQESAQPLLSPLYYVERALTPYTEIAVSNDANVPSSVQELLDRNLSVLVLADIGKLVPGTAAKLEEWVSRGGTLIRFAGPRLEKSADELLPVPLRRGGRTLGGSLSWSEAQSLAPFEDDSPFAGLTPPEEVKIHRQVLADPGSHIDAEIWATLKDGTPLISSAKRGNGRVVLFHVTANSEWSNLPLSGLFVEMLRRIVERSVMTPASEGGGASGEVADAAPQNETGVLSPLQVLDGFGRLVPPAATVRPLKGGDLGGLRPQPDHPPGYYGPAGSSRALNVIDADTTLKPISGLPAAISQKTGYGVERAIQLKPWLLGAGLAVFLADMIAVLVLAAGIGFAMSARRGAATVIVAGAALMLIAGPLQAQQGSAGNQSADQIALEAALQTRLAYVVTGDAEIDRTSLAGLTGLGKVLQARTAIEPGDPVGVSIESDELAFFPLLYWPIREDEQPLPEATLAKVDAFMKQGGMILFDTRDYQQSIPSGGGSTQGPGANALSRLLGNLDIPPLEPVREEHVLTKSFYLLSNFPGRWDGGTLWVEARADSDGAQERRARRADGVSSLLITSNDFAAAWALDDNNRPLYPVVPGGDVQREMAFRVGVNVVMYALTGNYKADQVHVPALLERLGQ